MHIFGIQIPPKWLSDEEYVNMIRKRLKTKQKFRIVSAALAVVTFAAIIWGIPVCAKAMISHVQLDSQQSQVYLAFGLAITVGIFIGMGIVLAAIYIVLPLLWHRTDKLLVHCWDSLHPSRNCIQDS